MFTCDAGAGDLAIAGSKWAGEFCGRARKSKTLPVAVHPLLLNAAKRGRATAEVVKSGSPIALVFDKPVCGQFRTYHQKHRL
jgi:hypothetical protein